MSGVPIVEFLTAQYDDAELLAKAVGPGVHSEWITRARSDGLVNVGVQGKPWIVAEQCAEVDARFIAVNDPAFVLADIAAKRRILTRMAVNLILYSPPDPNDWTPDRYMEQEIAQETARWVLGQMALPFADRPGYDEAWRP